jgi:DNA alkylation damage repair protein AlkB
MFRTNTTITTMMTTNNRQHLRQKHQQQHQRQQTPPPPPPPLRKRRLLQENDVHVGIVGGGLAGLSAALAILRSAKFSTTSNTNNSTSSCTNHRRHHQSHRVVKITIFERRCNPSSFLPPPPSSQLSPPYDNANDNSKNKDQDKGYGMTLTYDPVGPLAKLDILEEVAMQDCPSRCHYLFNENGDVRGYFGNAFYNTEWVHSNDGKGDEGSVGRGGGLGGQRGNMRIPRAELRNILLKKLMSEAQDTKKAMITESTTTTASISDASEGNCNNNATDNDANFIAVEVEILWSKRLLSYVDKPMMEKLRNIHGGKSNYVDVRSGSDHNSFNNEKKNGEVSKIDLSGHDEYHSIVVGNDNDNNPDCNAAPPHELDLVSEEKRQQQYQQEYQRHQRPVSLLFDDGTSAQVDLLIGADGVNSVVARQYLSTRIDTPTPKGTVMPSRRNDADYQNQCQSTNKKSCSSSSCSTDESIDDMALPRNLGIFIILGISDHFHQLIDERGFYTLDGMHRLFIMPYQGSRLDDDHDIDAPKNDNNDDEIAIGLACHDEVNAADASVTKIETTEVQTPLHTSQSYQSTNKRRKTMWQLSFPVSESSEAIRLSQLSQKELQLEVLQRCGKWHAPIPDLVNETPLESIWGTSLLDRDPQVFIDHRTNLEIHGRLPSRVVILGDAAHAMSPFKGQGANQALADGPLLANWLSKAQVDSAVRGFMAEMVRRSGVKVRASREAARELHSNQCWKWMVKQDTPVATSGEAVEANFHGVQTQYVSTLLSTLKENNVGATSGSNLDGAIRGIIRHLNCADNPLPNHSLSSAELSQLQSNALMCASAGKLWMLRQLSRKSPCVIQHARNGENKQSCLHLAAMQGRIDVCRWLLSEVYMDCNALDANEKSAVDLAIDAGYDNLAHELRRWTSQLEGYYDVERVIPTLSISDMKVISTINGVNHREENRTNCGISCNEGEYDAYRHVEQQLRGIRTFEDLRSLLRNNRENLSNSNSDSVTHVLGCHLDADDAKRDAYCINELAAHGAVLLRKFIPREVDQLSLAALALRPLNLNLTHALRALGAADECCSAIAAIGSNSEPASEKHRICKVSEGVKSSMSISADASIQTNFWPQMQNQSPDENQRKKRKMSSFPLHRLRYINLGEFNYNWSSRLYEKVQGAEMLPARMVALAQRAYAIAQKQTNEFRIAPVLFDMAICNIYHIQRSSDRLGGHKDNVENDLSAPLVTVSMGAPGIFLLGGISRGDVPTVILLEAGDCMVMSGKSRQYFHGVPTILSKNETDDHGFDDEAEAFCSFPELCESGTLHANVDENDPSIPTLDELRFAKAFLSTVRMNISIRQV